MKKEVKEEKKEVGFITVINIIAGVILAIFSLLTLIIKLFLPAGLFFILAVFIFFPQKFFKFNKWLKLLIAVVGFVAAITIAGYTLPSQQPQFVNYELNEEFIISYNKINFSMMVYNSTKEDKISLDGQGKTTNGVFLLVRGYIN